jgi:hypothetical protein
MPALLALALHLQSAAVSVSPAGPPARIVTDAGAGGYQAFPDVCRLKNGDLLCVFYAGYGHVSQPSEALPKGGRICAVRSRDEGATWSAPEVVVDTDLDDRDPSVMQLPSGEILVNFFTYSREQAVNACLVRSVTDSFGRESWSSMEIVLPGYATSSPIRRLRSGRLLWPVYYAQGHEKRSFSAVMWSDDNGKTWSAPSAIGIGDGLTLDEMDIYERKDGSLLAVMREVMAYSESLNRGRNWSPVKRMGFPGHCPYLLKTRSGVLLLAHRLPKTSLHYSIDEGRSWTGPIQIDDVIGAYPSMVELKNGQVLVIYYEEGRGSAIRSLRLNVSRQ